MDHDKDWVEVCCKVKGWRDGVYFKRGKNQEDEIRGGGMYPGCGG